MLVRLMVVVALVTLCSVVQAAQRKQSLLHAGVIVDALSSHSTPILVTSAMRGARVQGQVRASGGAGNDIHVMLMTEVAFANWSNGHTVEMAFTGGRRTVTELDVPLEPGTYRLVLANTFSTFTPKTVNGTVDLVWQMPDSLPVGKALRTRVNFITVPELAKAVTLPVSTPSGRGTISTSPHGDIQQVRFTLKRPDGAATIERVLGVVEAWHVTEAGSIDLERDGIDDGFFTLMSGGSGYSNRHLVVASVSKLALVELVIGQSHNAGQAPDVWPGMNLEDAKYADERAFLERMADAYLPQAETAQSRRDDPQHIFDTWVEDNGTVENGPMTIRRLKGRPVESGSALDSLSDGTVTYWAIFKGGVVAFDAATKEHYALFHPKDHYNWPTVLKKLGPFLVIGTRGEGLAIVDTRTFDLKRVSVPLGVEGVERIQVVGTKLRINGSVEVDAPAY